MNKEIFVLIEEFKKIGLNNEYVYGSECVDFTNELKDLLKLNSVVRGCD